MADDGRDTAAFSNVRSLATQDPFVAEGKHMRKSTVIKQLTALLVASMGLVISTSSTASADQAGVWMNDGHYFNIRSSASTSSTIVQTITDPDARVPCTTTPCTRENNGGSYTCWSGGPSGNDWVKVRWNGRTGWVAILCVEAGRI
ncbi:hypothetical protein ACWEWI_14335 [Streptomyces sp. NPDC003753]|uniref:hypothetical protein n=1 Tax=Streptomyces sp. NPDC058960 TaxID=3346679 RepID=UPI003691B127